MLNVPPDWLLCGNGSDDGLTASGTVEATEADMGFQVPGRVAVVLLRAFGSSPLMAFSRLLETIWRFSGERTLASRPNARV